MFNVEMIAKICTMEDKGEKIWIFDFNCNAKKKKKKEEKSLLFLKKKKTLKWEIE